jgi:decaprenyl-phosphate phosphoribosyltransferase
VKNLLVLAAPVAALGGSVTYDYRDVALKVAIAFIVFSLAASSIYLVNDARDVEADRRIRPSGSGRSPPASCRSGWPTASPSRSAWRPGHLVVADTAAGGRDGRLPRRPAGLLLRLKHQAVLDICIVSSGFLLRAIAGGVAAGIPLSQWFLLVMAFGSLFMAAGKRYAELQLAERTGAKIRRSLESYTSTYLRFVWTLSATAVVLCGCGPSSGTAPPVPGS